MRIDSLAVSRNDSYSNPLNPNYNKGLGDFGSHATPPIDPIAHFHREFCQGSAIAGGAR